MLNKEQQQVVNSTAKRILVLAGAGTGKTKVLIERIIHLVKQGVDPSCILSLTFTNAAAIEMRERYNSMVCEVTNPTFGTFHSFCYGLIIHDFEVCSALGYSSIPEIAKDEDIKRIEMSIKTQCGIKLSHDILFHDSAPKRVSDVTPYRIFRKQYEQTLRKENLITFDIMCYGVCKLFANSEPCIQKYKDRYKYIFVDEFQDTDIKQWDFITTFQDANLLVVGDAKQNLYSFRGSTSAIIKSLSNDSGWETIRLSQNYRSTKQICDFANEIHNSWKDAAYNLEIHSDVNGDAVQTLTDNSASGILPALMLDTILQSKSIGDTMAILCRSNAEVKNVIATFNFANIPFVTKQSDTISEKEHILLCAIDSSHLISWVSNKLNTTEYADYLKLCALNPTFVNNEQAFIKTYYNRFSDYFDIILNIRKILNTDCFATGKIISICSILRIKTPDNVAYVSVSQIDIIAKCIDYLHADIAKSNVPIYIGTIHSVKGLEYDIVHLIGVGSKSFPITNEEQRNIYYVGCTRAKKKLYVWKSL